MAIDTTDQIVQERVKHKLLQIAGATGQGESPYSLYKPSGVTNPGRGEAVYGTEKDGQRYFEFLKAMMIDPANNIRKTGGPLGNDDSYGRGNVPGHPDWKISAGPQLPNFKPMGRVIKGVREGVLPLKDTKIKQNLQIGPQANIKDSMQRENVGGTLRDMLLPLLIKEYGKDGSGGYKNPSKLLSGMKNLAKNQLPANNIRRLQDTGHMTIPQNPDGTGPLRIIDLLGPQAKGIDLGGGRSLGMPEIRALRGIFQGASEAERNKLIEKYSNRPFKGLV